MRCYLRNICCRPWVILKTYWWQESVLTYSHVSRTFSSKNLKLRALHALQHVFDNFHPPIICRTGCCTAMFTMDFCIKCSVLPQVCLCVVTSKWHLWSAKWHQFNNLAFDSLFFCPCINASVLLADSPKRLSMPEIIAQQTIMFQGQNCV